MPASKIAEAYVQIVPRIEGMQAALKKQLDGDLSPTLDQAGTKGGQLFGGKFEKAAKGLFAVAIAGAGIAAASVGIALSKGFERLQGIEEAQAKLVGLGNTTEDVSLIMENALSAVRGTAFGMADAATIAASAVAAGVAPGEDLAYYLKTVADASYIAGVELSDMGNILNKATTSGKAQNDVLGQLSERGIPIYQMLGEVAGVAAGEIFDMASEGEISSKMLMTALSTNLGGAALESGNTVAGSFANMNAAIGRVGANLLTGAFPLFKDFFSGVITALGPLEDVAKELGADLGKQLAPVFEKLIASLPTLLAAIVPMVPMMGLLLEIFFDFAILALPLIMKGIELFVPILGQAVEMLGSLAGWMSENLEVVKLLAVVLGTLTAGVIIYNTALKMQAAFQALVAATNPFALIAIAVAALVAGIVFLATQTTFFQDVWATMSAFFVSVYETYIKPVIEGFLGALADLGNFFTTLWTDYIQPAIQAIGDMFVWLYENVVYPIFALMMIPVALWAALFEWVYQNVIEPVFDLLTKLWTFFYEEVVTPVIDGLVLAWENMGKMIDWVVRSVVQPVFDFFAWGFEYLYENVVKPVAAFIEAAFEAMGDAYQWVLDNIITPVSKMIEDAFTTVGDTTESVFQAVSDFMEDTFKNLVNFVRVPLNTIIGFINKVISALNTISIDIPDWVPVWGGQTFGISIPKVPKIPEMAAGGYVDQPTTALIGEAGPEVVTPLRDFERMMGIADRQQQKVVNYYAAPNNSLDSEQALFQAMRRAKVVAAW
tara:strand:- start:73 stop:2394 length:2322 start_codon:yes stop_codon:yes gene_type:complete